MMRETLSQTNLLELPMLAFFIFLTVFVIVVARVLLRGRKDPAYAAMEQLPLAADADISQATRPGSAILAKTTSPTSEHDRDES